jgi:predicted ester cyclase
MKMIFLFLIILSTSPLSVLAQDGPDRDIYCERENKCPAPILCQIETTKNGKSYSTGGGWGSDQNSALANFLNRYPENNQDEFKAIPKWCRDVQKARAEREALAANPELRCQGRGFIKSLPAACEIPRNRWADCCVGSLCDEVIIKECNQQSRLKSSPIGLVVDSVRGVDEGYNYVVEFRVTNNQSFQIKDILIKCDQIGKSGTILFSNEEVLYDFISPKITKQFSQKFSSHKQMNSVSCQIKAYKK